MQNVDWKVSVTHTENNNCILNNSCNVLLYCVYPAMSKSPKQLPQLSENSWSKRRFNRSNGVLYHVRAYNIIPFLSVALHNSGIRKYIFRSVTVYNNNKSSSQWNSIVQIEPVQDKIFSKTWNYSRTYQLWILIRIRVPTKPFGFFLFRDKG
jgi:hypothetical protein